MDAPDTARLDGCGLQSTVRQQPPDQAFADAVRPGGFFDRQPFVLAVIPGKSDIFMGLPVPDISCEHGFHDGLPQVQLLAEDLPGRRHVVFHPLLTRPLVSRECDRGFLHGHQGTCVQ